MGKVYIIAAVLAILPGCASLESRLDVASQAKGQSQARVTLPAPPADLTKKEPHAPLEVGMEALSVLKRERAVVDRLNARVARWTAFYASLRAKLK